MQNWQRRLSHRRYKKPDGSFTYTVKVDGVEITVREEVYKTYAQSERREMYWAERDAGRMLSLDRMMEDDVLLEFLTDEHIESAEDSAMRTIFAKQAMSAFMALAPDEKHLIQALVIDGMTERDYAAEIGLSQKGVNKRKHKILEKLKNAVLKP